MKKFIQWLFWNVVYTFRPTPKEINGFITMKCRKRWPWKKFAPCLYYSSDFRRWNVWFSNHRGYVDAEGQLKVRYHRDMQTGKVVGLTILEKDLQQNE